MRVSYQDWSSSSATPNSWRSAEMKLDYGMLQDGGYYAFEIYLRRSNSKKDTFMIEMDEKEARELYAFLKTQFEEA